MNRQQAESQARERRINDRNNRYVAELVGDNVWTVKKYPKLSV